jgi:hypothetical protein
MNATDDIAMKSASSLVPLVDIPATTQREKNLRSFQEKYDAMLYIVEFIASFHLGDIRNSEQAKKMDDLKSLVVQARNGMGIRC